MQMSLCEKLNQPSLFRKLLYYPLAAGILCFSNCGKDDSGQSNPYTPPGGNNGGYVENEGETNDSGELKLEIENKKFDIHVSDDENGEDINHIEVKGDYFGDNIYGFSFEDFYGNYFSDIFYVDINNSFSINEADGFSINKSLNKIRGRSYEKKYHDESEPYPYNLSQNPHLSFLKTITIDNLYDFYVEHDAIIKNISNLEFIKDITGRPELSFALEAAKFRQTFIENLNNYNEIVNSIASLFGGSFEKEAYYIDIYENNLNVLTHQTTTKGNYITLKGNVYNNENLSKIGETFIDITRGPVRKSTYSNNSGGYFFKFLMDGNYDFRASHFGFDDCNENGKRLVFNGYTQPRCNLLNFYLTPEHHVTIDTLLLRPGPEGKDAYVSYEYPNTNYGDDEELYMWYYFGGSQDIRRSYIHFDTSSIPNNAIIKSATLSGWGLGIAGDGNLTLAVKKVLDWWSEYQINWVNQPRFDSFTYDTAIPNQPPYTGLINFSFPDLVQEWVEEENNKGIAIVFDEESGRKYARIHSSDYTNYNFRWEVEIIYEY